MSKRNSWSWEKGGDREITDREPVWWSASLKLFFDLLDLLWDRGYVMCFTASKRVNAHKPAALTGFERQSRFHLPIVSCVKKHSCKLESFVVSWNDQVCWILRAMLQSTATQPSLPKAHFTTRREEKIEKVCIKWPLKPETILTTKISEKGL